MSIKKKVNGEWIDCSFINEVSNSASGLITPEDKQKLDSIAQGAEVNVNADWDAISGDAQILNKPNLSLVATSGNYNDLINKPNIPSSATDIGARPNNWLPTLTDLGINATAAELNYVDGVTGNIQEQLSSLFSEIGDINSILDSINGEVV